MPSGIVRRVVTLLLLATAATVSSPAAAADDPYSLPWQLRLAGALTVVRVDSMFSGYTNAAGASGGFAVAPTLTASYKIPGTGIPGLTDGFSGLAPFVRFAAVNDSPPSPATGGFAIVNPLVGATYGISLPASLRASAFLCATIPVGMGNGDTPSAGVTDARSAGQNSRSQLDDALFAVDDFALLPGVDLAWVSGGITLQVEAAVAQLWRVNGSGINPATKKAPDPDPNKTNFSSGVHLGYFIIPLLSVGAELRYQRWLTPPMAVTNDKTGTLPIDNATFAIGPRLHLPLGPVTMHPGIAWSQGIDAAANAPLNFNHYHTVQLDIPLVF
jgi:hypothetical protein